MIRIQWLRCIFLAAICSPAFAQESDKPVLSVSGYLEAYTTLQAPGGNGQQRPFFLYNHTQTQEVSINLALIRTALQTDALRASVGLMAGTYAEANLAAEPAAFRHVFEAYAGVRLSAKRQLWFDAGIMPSHIGAESAIGKDCWTLSRSLAAENSPYYEAGAKLGYTSPNEKIYLAALVLNGWQRIRRPAGVPYLPAFGTQLQYRPREGAVLNWSTYAGQERVFPPSGGPQEVWRLFQNLYAQLQLPGGIGLLAAADLGVQQDPGGGMQPWATPQIVCRKQLNGRIWVAGRGEYYIDPEGIIIRAPGAGGAHIAGASLNFDYAPSRFALLRIEGRGLWAQQLMFQGRSSLLRHNYSLACALCVGW